MRLPLLSPLLTDTYTYGTNMTHNITSNQ